MEFKTTDGEIIKTDLPLANFSARIRAALEFGGNATISLPQCVESNILQIILMWVDNHKNYAVPLAYGETENKTKLTQWDWDLFSKLERKTLFRLAIASDYLEMEILLDSINSFIAGWINKSTPAEFRKKFALTVDTDAYEEQKLKVESEWTEEWEKNYEFIPKRSP